MIGKKIPVFFKEISKRNLFLNVTRVFYFFFLILLKKALVYK